MKNEIKMYLHCAKCLHELPAGVSPADYAKVNVGITNDGIQIWCIRHDCNVALLTKDDIAELKDVPCACCGGNCDHTHHKKPTTIEGE